MITGDSKRIIIIKNISSDLIEEAILILKPERSLYKNPWRSTAVKNNAGEKNVVLLKEAESIINNYLKENKLNVIPERRLGKKPFLNRRITMVDLIINLLMFSSIALLIFLTFKLF